MEQPSAEDGSSSTDATVAELPVVKLPAPVGEVESGKRSVEEEASSEDTATGEIVDADLVGDPA